MKLIAVTGYPHVGKTTAIKFFEKKGFFKIDLDAIKDKLYKGNMPGANKIEAYFGYDFIKKDGSVDQNKLRKAVFNNPQKLRILDSFINPLIIHEIKIILNQIASEFQFAIIEIPIYRKEAKLNDLIDAWLLVKNSRIDVRNVNGKDLSEFYQDLQFLKTDYLIDNDGNLEDLEIKLENLSFI